ncbi:MAG: TSUP family transporter, partial [Proteobacteria bacterium]|nr:TSUP family transporter [Pseudomonadota bacterium]
MTVLEIMAVASILGLAAFTLNFAGFGNALVAVPLLALLMPIKAAVALQFPFALILLIYNAWRWRGRVELRRLVVPIIAALIALPLGFLALEYLPAGVMKKALAGFIVLAVLALRLGLIRRLAQGPVQKPWLGALCGLLSGVFQGAYTT